MIKLYVDIDGIDEPHPFDMKDDDNIALLLSNQMYLISAADLIKMIKDSGKQPEVSFGLTDDQAYSD